MINGRENDINALHTAQLDHSNEMLAVWLCFMGKQLFIISKGKYELGFDEYPLSTAFTTCVNEIDGETVHQVEIDEVQVWQSVFVRDTSTGQEWKTRDGDEWYSATGDAPPPDWLRSIKA